MADLLSELKDLVDWGTTVIHLPEMSNVEVDKEERDGSTVDEKKRKALGTWLRRCPEASWSHVRDALHIAGEYTLEKKIATNHGLSLHKDLLRNTQDDKAITCPRTAEQTGSMTVAASSDPRHKCCTLV